MCVCVCVCNCVQTIIEKRLKLKKALRHSHVSKWIKHNNQIKRLSQIDDMSKCNEKKNNKNKNKILK